MAASPKERAAVTDDLQPDQHPDDTSATEESHAETENQAEEPQPREASPHEDVGAETEQLEDDTDKKEGGEVSGDDEEDENKDGDGEDKDEDGGDKSEDEDEKPNDGSTKDTGDTHAEAASGDVAAPPPLPDEPLPEVQEDDGWDPMWSDEHKSWFFFNRFTKQTQWENPRVPTAGGRAAAAVASGGYNPAIHGDYDPNAWYAKGLSADPDARGAAADGADGAGGDADMVAAAAAAAAASTIIGGGGGGVDVDGHGESQFSHDAKARRQMNAYFDMDAAASAHDGRSLKAERSGKKPTRAELKAFKEKRRARKEEKRRAWLRD